jgi:hypothetical protein
LSDGIEFRQPDRVGYQLTLSACLVGQSTCFGLPTR